MSFLSKVELKKQLTDMGIKVEGNYVRSKDIKEVLADKQEAITTKMAKVIDVMIEDTKTIERDCTGWISRWIYTFREDILKKVKVGKTPSKSAIKAIKKGMWVAFHDPENKIDIPNWFWNLAKPMEKWFNKQFPE